MGLALSPSSSGCLSPIFSIQPSDSLSVCSVPFHPRFSLSTSAPLLLFCQYPLHNLFGPLALCCSLVTSILYQFCCQPNESSAEIFSPITWSVSSFHYALAVGLWNSSMARLPSLQCLQQCSFNCMCNNEDHYHWYVCMWGSTFARLFAWFDYTFCTSRK